MSVVYAVDARGTGGTDAIIANINHCGEVLVTAPQFWKCSDSCPHGWQQQGFDDSDWPTATDLGGNGVDPWGMKILH